MTDCAVLVFVRAPEAGRVKTRLAAEVGAEAALRVYVRLAEHALAEARVSGAAVRVHFTPAEAEPAVREWLGEPAAYLPQAGGDLGERMRAAFEAAFEAGYRRVAIIGSDLPGLSAELLRRAFALLEASDAVLGPARDGGYYLLALRRVVPDAFRGIAWSTDGVLRETVERLRDAGAEPAMLETLADVDLAADLPPGWRAWAE
ncbi:MAG TPA: TIGR04282 family arsenosugar biosynthesis glycosyltransferase [Longimicrobiaceae bacterium]|nr:TIGR04282 family arsenosugar biosynthesis glycosyltransferase [Longimicrobiaceae bacterium]